MRSLLILAAFLSAPATGWALCGDGIVEPSEACDDGNVVPSDGCDDVCAIETGFTCGCEVGGDIDVSFSAPTALYGSDNAPFTGISPCPAGEVLHGFTGVRVDAVPGALTTMDLICGPATIDGGGEVIISPQAPVPGARTTRLPSYVPTTTWTATCPDDHAVVGISSEIGTLAHPSLNIQGITGIELICAELIVMDDVIVTGEARTYGPPIGEGSAAGGPSTVECGTDTVSMGMGGWGNASITGLRLGCATTSTTCGDEPSICREFEICGDGIIEGLEQCDDGDTLDNECNATCTNAVCGDGFVAQAEDCDDGNDTTSDLCTNLCTVAFCGDGIAATEAGEECDDFNITNTDSCTADCREATCGDGFIQPVIGEQCERGDAGCNNDCLFDRDISGRVWLDTNQDGVQDADELGVPGVTLTLLDSSDQVVDTTVTGADGEHSFVVTDGDYVLVVDATNFDDGGALEDTDTLAGNTILLNITDDVDDADFAYVESVSEYLGWAAVTTGTSGFYAADEQWTLSLIDVRVPQFGGGDYVPDQYQHPSWTGEQLGNVFGIASDADGALYVTATSNVATYLGTDVWRYGDIGGGADSLAAAGTVYRIEDGGAPTVFAQLPQQLTTITSGGLNTRDTGPGLGNITYDRDNDQFFVSNMEDGSIYRLDADGTTQQVYDPLFLDDGNPGFAPLGERVWGLAVWEDRLYYGLNRTGEDHIRSVALRANGSINAVDDQFEFIASNPFNAVPVADISFSPSGRMAIGHRTMSSDVVCYNHAAGVTVYEEDAAGNWVNLKKWNPSIIAETPEAYGGVSWATDDLLWATGADLLDEIETHGLVGREMASIPTDFTGGDAATAAVIKYDPLNMRDTKGIGGDIEIIQD